MDDSGISSSLSWTVLKDFSHFLQGTAVIDVIQALGWMIVIKLSLIMTSTGILWSEGQVRYVTQEDLVYCLAIHFFLKIRTWTVAGNHPAVRFKIKLWHVWIWDALVDPSISFNHFDDMWKSVSRIFVIEKPWRFVVNGWQVNTEWPLSIVLCGVMKAETLN